MSLFHWGMVSAADVPHGYWRWANFVDCLFEHSQAECDEFFRYVDQIREDKA